MAVSGFMMRIDQAKALSDPSKKDKLYLVKHIEFAHLAKAFETHPNWKGLQDENSDFSKFIKNTCGDEGKICTINIRVLGIMLCNGDADKRAEELYNLMQDNGKIQIAAGDRDFRPNFDILFN